MSSLESDLKALIIETLSLEDVKPEDIDADENLFDEQGLVLDSIDALELGVTIQKKYGIKIDPQDKNVASHFRSIRALADFIGKTA